MQILKLKGLTKTAFESKKTQFEAAIATLLSVPAKTVSITAVDEMISTQRRMRALQESTLKITYKVTVSDKDAPAVLEIVNAGTTVDSSPFLKALVQKVALLYEKSQNSLSLTSEPAIMEIDDNTDDNATTKDDITFGLQTILVIGSLVICCGCCSVAMIFWLPSIFSKKTKKKPKNKSVQLVRISNIDKPHTVVASQKETGEEKAAPKVVPDGLWANATANPLREPSKQVHQRRVLL